ncbi:Uncharacterised protein [Mycobacteroides abscessus subsp. abscessus]|nr:Uncharacterised protein [Mycobacteroides abscessus subsp. abscessus]
MSSSHANPAAVIPAYTRQSVSEFSSWRRRPVSISSRKAPLAASSMNGARMAIEAKDVLPSGS